MLKGKSLKTLENKGFEALLQLFKLYRSRRFFHGTADLHHS